jgi:hypothetical protein
MAMQNRPLRPFEHGAHLHVLDWAHETARYRLRDAGDAQVKAAARAIAKASQGASGPPELPSLHAAMTGELRKLYSLGHATVRSELDHQRSQRKLPVGLSQAPAPPNLRKAKAKKGKARACATCLMFDAGLCWGYGNYPVKPNQVCDSYAPETSPKQLAEGEPPEDPGSVQARGRLIGQAVTQAIWQAIQRGRLGGIGSTRRLRDLGEAAGHGALRSAASSHSGGAINAGRQAAAQAAGDEVIGARYTSVLDKNTCGACRDADDGVLRRLDDPGLAPAPNPACEGGDRCRCIHVYQLRSET